MSNKTITTNYKVTLQIAKKKLKTTWINSEYILQGRYFPVLIKFPDFFRRLRHNGDRIHMT